MKSFGLPVEDLSAIKLLAKHFKKRGFEGAFSLGLGKKALDVAKQGDDVLRGGYSCVRTRRDRKTGKVEIEREPLPIQNKDVIIFDDIISSGGTMAEAVKLAREMKARRVISACVHPLLVGDALERIRRNGADEIVGTDCVSSPVSVVSVAPLIAEALAKLAV
jgi:ribose-phosphate pyrophosphokinase